MTSGKLLTFVSTLGIIAALAVILRKRTNNLLLAIAIASVLLATFVGHKGSLTIRGDVLPLALSLAALALLATDEMPGRWTLLASALLAGVSPLVKFTSFHALSAGFIFLVQRDRKRALIFTSVGAGAFLLGLVLTNALSGGGFMDNLSASVVAGSNKRDLLGALEIYLYWVKSDPPFVLLFAFAVLALFRARFTLDLFTSYFLLHLFISLGFFFDTGAEYNHLIDLAAAALILASEHLRTTKSPLRVATITALIAASIYGLAVHHAGAWRAPERQIDVGHLLKTDLGLEGKRFLAHDPTVSVLMNQRPIAADDFQFRVLVAKGIVPNDELPGRVRAKEFDRIVLLNRFEPASNDPSYYRDREFGPEVARAIRDTYTLDRKVYKYYVYRPNGEPAIAPPVPDHPR